MKFPSIQRFVLGAVAGAALIVHPAVAADLYFSTSTINTAMDPNNATWAGSVWNSTSTGDAPTQGWVDGNVAVLPDSPNAKATGILLGANRSVSGLVFQNSPGSGIVYLDGIGAFGLTLDNGGGEVDVNVATGQAALVFASVSGTSGLNKTGGGSFEIRGSGAGLSGPIVISDGTLFGGSTAEAFNIASGGFSVAGGLMGSGNEVGVMNVGGTVSMTSGAISVALDGDVGAWALRSDADFLLSGGQYNLTILGLGDFDQIVGTGSGSVFSLGGSTIALQSGSVVDYSATYQIFSGFNSGNASGVSFWGFDSGYTPHVSSSGVLSFNAVPEPSTWALLALAIVAAGILPRRRASSASHR